jgi:hypothetical protein
MVVSSPLHFVVVLCSMLFLAVETVVVLPSLIVKSFVGVGLIDGRSEKPVVLPVVFVVVEVLAVVLAGLVRVKTSHHHGCHVVVVSTSDLLSVLVETVVVVHHLVCGLHQIDVKITINNIVKRRHSSFEKVMKNYNRVWRNEKR